MRYRRIAKNISAYSLFPENVVVDDIIETYGINHDYYESIFTYSEQQYEQYIEGLKQAADYLKIDLDEEYIIESASNIRKMLKDLGENEKDKQAIELYKLCSVKGSKDVLTHRIVFDFDDEHDVNAARQEAIETVARLAQYGVPADQIQIYFSGKKGFSVETLINKDLTQPEFVNIVNGIAGDLRTFDTSVKDAQRLFRIPLTKHQDSGLYKTPLTKEELTEYPIDIILKHAEEPCSSHYDIIDDWGEIELPPSLEKLKNIVKDESKKETVNQLLYSDTLDLSRKPKWMPAVKYALQEGFFIEGERNYAFMVLASTYKAQGYNKTLAFNMLKGVAEIQAERESKRLNTTIDPYPEDKIYREVIEYVYSPLWNGGTYSAERDDLLQKVKERLGLKDDTSKKSLLTIDDVIGEFDYFATNIEKNRINLGVIDVDNTIHITTDMMVGLLGAPGCHAKGTRLLLSNGIEKNVEDVRVGDELIGPDTNIRTVLKLHHGNDIMLKVIPDGMYAPFIVNLHHMFYVWDNELRCLRSISGAQMLFETISEFPRFQLVQYDKTLIYFEIEKLDQDEYFGFELDKDHLYVTLDGFIHHNSGKTSISLGFLENISANNSKGMFFSFDMPASLITTRLMQRYTGLKANEVWESVKNSKKELLQVGYDNIRKNFKHVKFVFKNGYGVEDIENEIVKEEQATGEKIKLVVVDYLERINGPYSEPTANSSMIASKLMEIANNHHVCIVLLLQPQKSTGDSANELLSIRNVKGSSMIEQSCRVILSVWRPGFSPKDFRHDRYMSMAVVKNTMGSLGQFDFQWDGVRGQISQINDMEDFFKVQEIARMRKEAERKNLKF